MFVSVEGIGVVQVNQGIESSQRSVCRRLGVKD